MKKLIYLFVLISFFVNGNALKAQGNATWTLGSTNANGNADIEANPVAAVVPGTNDVVIAYRSNPGHLRLSRVDLTSEKLKWPSDRDVTINTTHNVYPTAILCQDNSIYVAAITSTIWEAGGSVGNSYVMRFDLSTGNLLSSTELADNGTIVPHIRNIHFYPTTGQPELICTGFKCISLLGDQKDKYIVKLNPTTLSAIAVYQFSNSAFEHDVIYSSLINSNGNIVAVGYEIASGNSGNSYIMEINPVNGNVIRYLRYQIAANHSGSDKIVEKVVNGSSEYYVANHRNNSSTKTDIAITKITPGNSSGSLTFTINFSYLMQETNISNQDERCMDLFLNDTETELIVCGQIANDYFIRTYDISTNSMSISRNFRTSRNINKFAHINDNLICAVGDNATTSSTNPNIQLRSIVNNGTSNPNTECTYTTVNLETSITSNTPISSSTPTTNTDNNAEDVDLAHGTVKNILENICGGTVQNELCSGEIQVLRNGCADYSFSISDPHGTIKSIVWTINGKLLGEKTNVNAILGAGINTICVKYFVQGNNNKAISSCCEKCTTIVSLNLSSTDVITLQDCNFGGTCVPYTLDRNELFNSNWWARYQTSDGVIKLGGDALCLPIGEHEINYYDEFGCLLHTRRINVISGAAGGSSSICEVEQTVYVPCARLLNDQNFWPTPDFGPESECWDCFNKNSKSFTITNALHLGNDPQGNEIYRRTVRNFETCKECTFTYKIIDENCDFEMPTVDLVRDPVTNQITGYRWVFPSGAPPTNISHIINNGSILSDQNQIVNYLAQVHGIPESTQINEINLEICRKRCPESPQLVETCCNKVCYKIIRNNANQPISLIPCDEFVDENGYNVPSTPESPQPAPLEAETALKIVPNPTTSVFRIVPDQAGEAAATYKTVRVFDATGKQVMEKTDVNSNTWFDISALNPGIYLVKTTFNEKEVVLRVMRQDD